MFPINKFLILIRWKNLLIILLTQYTARLFLIDHTNRWRDSFLDYNQFLISLCTVLVAASGYIINDYFDVKIDQVNKPEKVIIGRFIRRRHAILAHQALNIAAAVIAFTINWKVFIINILAMSSLWFYASVFKKLPFVGNFLVACLTGASLVVMAVFYTANDLILNIYALFAFGITLIRELIKDIEDIRGDQQYASTTLPIIWGIRQTKMLLFVFMALLVVAVASMGVALHNPKLSLAFLFLGIPFGYLAYCLYFADQKAHFSHLSWVSKHIMILGVLSMIFV